MLRPIEGSDGKSSINILQSAYHVSAQLVTLQYNIFNILLEKTFEYCAPHTEYWRE